MGNKTSTSWQKGSSGNAKGRPPKSRALTAILERAGNAKLDCKDGSIEAKKLLADLLWQAATTGMVIFPDGMIRMFDAADWMATVKFIYQHIDGPPKTEMDITSNGETLLVKVDK